MTFPSRSEAWPESRGLSVSWLCRIFRLGDPSRILFLPLSTSVATSRSSLSSSPDVFPSSWLMQYPMIRSYRLKGSILTISNSYPGSYQQHRKKGQRTCDCAIDPEMTPDYLACCRSIPIKYWHGKKGLLGVRALKFVSGGARTDTKVAGKKIVPSTAISFIVLPSFFVLIAIFLNSRESRMFAWLSS